MVNPNWGLMQPVDIAGRFQQGMEQGRQRRIETETDNALRTYAENPSDPNAVNSLMRFNPRLGMQLREQQQEQMRRQQGQADTGAALGGDMQAFTRLAQTDPEQWARIRPQIEEMNNTIGQVAMASATPEQWDANVRRLAETFGPHMNRYIGRFDLRDVAIAQSGQMTQWLESQRPRFQSVAPGGSVVAMDPDGTNAGYVAGGPQDAPDFIPRSERPPVAPTAPIVPQAAPQPGLRPMPQRDADMLRRAIGDQAFQEYLRTQGLQVVPDSTPIPNALPEIEAEMRRRGLL
ncbi:hypothetical protein UFOVP319_33 [uncultured Caudovirales phage]|uniref:Uncharacterized protein n=1 Tax=uncultured Caudovirales phage TaxID=2100421 RepID=A0A6J5LXG8_9CAUD|nr:hypothetical protein UFOVP319_33 [uncultured Caudovirales phage]